MRTPSACIQFRYIANRKVDGCFLAGHGAIFAILAWIHVFEHLWNAQLAELTAQRIWLDLHKSSTTSFHALMHASEKFSIHHYLTEIVRSASVVKFT